MKHANRYAQKKAQWAWPAVLFLLLVWWSAPPARAGEGDDQVYLPVETFLASVFDQAPAASMMWLNESQRDSARLVSDEDPGFRKRYWRSGDTIAWVLDVIGRDHPITVGVVTGPGGIQSMQVLVYRESRGWEVRHEFFTRQFAGARLDGNALDHNIDNITGATLSVQAMKRAARLALWGQQHVVPPEQGATP